MSDNDADLPLGCQVVTPRQGFAHHGIYAGDGEVVHYAGLSRAWRRGPVELVSLETFADGRDVWIEPTPYARYTGQHAVERAFSRLGEDRYRIANNNCEHFCAWCLDGEGRSKQIDHFLAWPRTAARAMLARFAQVLGVGPSMRGENSVTSAVRVIACEASDA